MRALIEDYLEDDARRSPPPRAPSDEDDRMETLADPRRAAARAQKTTLRTESPAARSPAAVPRPRAQTPILVPLRHGEIPDVVARSRRISLAPLVIALLFMAAGSFLIGMALSGA